MTRGTAEGRVDAIAVDLGDNVATVLRVLRVGEVARIRRGAEVMEVRVAEEIPFGHKVALAPIAAGAPVTKYGAPIGRATAEIRSGDHVHIGNLVSNRARRAQD